MMRLARFALLALVAGCAPATAPPASVVGGTWGGTQVSMVLKPSGGTVSWPCGSGTIDSSWVVTPAGVFDASGEYFTGGGPVPIGGTTPHPASYSGLLSGNLLTLTVTVADLHETLGPFVLVRDGPPVRQVCL